MKMGLLMSSCGQPGWIYFVKIGYPITYDGKLSQKKLAHLGEGVDYGAGLGIIVKKLISLLQVCHNRTKKYHIH